MSQRFKLALPGFDAQSARVWEEVLDNLYPSPKIDTTPVPPHAGIIFLNWADTTAVPNNTTKLLYSFPHGYNHIPTVFASYSYDNGTIRLRGTLAFQNGALGMITIDADEENINLKYYSFDLASTAITPFIMQVRFYVMAEHGYES